MDGLYHRPCRCVGIFERHLVGAAIREGVLWHLDLDILALLRYIEWYGLEDALAGVEHWQVVLLSVAEAINHAHNLADEQRVVDIGVVVEDHLTGGVGIKCERHTLPFHFLTCVCIGEQHGGCSADGLFGLVDDGSGNFRLVAVAEEAWHVGLNHEVLLRLGFGSDKTIFHVLGIGESHELPFRQALGQVECDAHVTVLVGNEVGLVEGCL